MILEESKKVVVTVSGGFDPLHIGHVDMFEAAKELAGKDGTLVVIVNNDNWLHKKKGKIFMPQKERMRIIKSIRYVDEVVLTEHARNDTDMSVCSVLRGIKPDIFANGGDKSSSTGVPEVKLCKELGIRAIFNIGGGKVQSSSWLLDRYENG